MYKLFCKKMKIKKLTGVIAVMMVVVIIITSYYSTVISVAGVTPDNLKINTYDGAELMAEGSHQLQLYAQNAVLMDGETGDILYEKDSGEHKANASTTKILTCILALECGDINDKVSVSPYASKQPEVRLGAPSGDCFTMEDMLYAMMLESYNDTAVVIAEHIGGSVKAFAEMMNQKAKEIGCHSTYFITPNGLDAQDEYGMHGTTAKDLALIMRYCIFLSPKKDEFLKITRTPAYTFSNESGTRSFSCVNHNAFLNMSEEALTGKTGFTCNAGYCYVGSAVKDGHTYIWSLLGCGWPGNKTYKWKDSRILLSYAEEYADYVTLEAPRSPDVTVNYSSQSAKTDHVSTKCNFTGIAAQSTDTQKSTNYVYKVLKNIKAPIHNGEIVGNLWVYRDQQLVDIVPVTAVEEKKDINFKEDIIKVFRQGMK